MLTGKKRRKGKGNQKLWSGKGAAKSLQSCLTLCNLKDGSPPGSTIPGILQARTLEWVAISFSNVWKWKGKVKSLSHVWLFVTPWTAAYHALPPLEFSRQEYWSRLPLPSLGKGDTLLNDPLYSKTQWKFSCLMAVQTPAPSIYGATQQLWLLVVEQ